MEGNKILTIIMMIQEYRNVIGNKIILVITKQTTKT